MIQCRNWGCYGKNSKLHEIVEGYLTQSGLNFETSLNMWQLK